MSQKRVSRAGIQPSKPICPLESTDIKKDGTIADLRPRLAPKPSRLGRQHARRQHEQGLPSSSYRDPVHHSALEMQERNRASGTFAPRPLWEPSRCLSGSFVFCRSNYERISAPSDFLRQWPGLSPSIQLLRKIDTHELTG